MKMSHWFRLYECVLDDPKVQRLSDELFKTWVNILCVASKNKGVLPPVGDIAFALRVTEDEANKRLKALQKAGLVDELDGIFTPHNWEARQFKSDTSSERVKRYRERYKERSKVVSSTVSVTPPETETETEIDKELVASDDAGPLQNSSEKKVPTKSSGMANKFFDEFWQAYPKRTGADPKEPARKSYLKATEREISPSDLLDAVKRFAASPDVSDAKFIPMAATWLNQKRWEQYQTTASPQQGNSSGSVTPMPAFNKTKVPVTDKDHGILNRLYRLMTNNIPLTTQSGTYFPNEWLAANREDAAGKLEEMCTGKRTQPI